MRKQSLHDYFEELRASEGLNEGEVINALDSLANGSAGTGTAGVASAAGHAGMAKIIAIISLITVMTSGGLYFLLNSGEEEPASREPSQITAEIPMPAGHDTIDNEIDISLPDDSLQSTPTVELAEAPQNITRKNARTQNHSSTTVSQILDSPESAQHHLTAEVKRKIVYQTDHPLPPYGDYHIENVSSLNTPDLEYGPSMAADGETLFFISNREGGVGGHDVWYARKIDATSVEFSEPVNLGPPLNTTLNEGMVAMSADRSRIFFTACNRNDGVGDCDIYTAQYNNGVVSDIENMRAVNSSEWDAQPTISDDGNTLYFVSNRTGVLGSSDIFVATRNEEGSWNEAEPLPPPVNTSGKEDSPFILPGSNRLYFSTDGYDGMGRLDFFVSDRDADGNWSMPRNLGHPFNTELDDRMLTATPDEKQFYFTSERSDPSNKGVLDIFTAVAPVSSTYLLEPESDAGSKLQLYPNPASDYVSFKIHGNLPHNRDLVFINMRTGEETLRIEDAEPRSQIPISSLASGLYIVLYGDVLQSSLIIKE